LLLLLLVEVKAIKHIRFFVTSASFRYKSSTEGFEECLS